MKKLFSVSQTAKTVDMTAETLRHYDRIGLVKPCKVDEWTGYRYYSRQEIVKLNTIRALRVMDLTLAEIKNILEYDDFSKIIELLKKAEKSADDKIAELNYAKSKIQNARTFYESKLQNNTEITDTVIKTLPQRVILLLQNMQTPTLDNLWDYHRHFYKQLGEENKDKFAFEDLAGIYEENGQSNLFAVCTRYANIKGLKILPKGRYICADCTEKNMKNVTEKLIEKAKRDYGKKPTFAVHLVVLTGILQWNYQTQIFID